ncbi:MAG: antitoxin Xre/MbcA/ParS toxin-binding domain-containing protein [Egibacteraceae bacterium]
MASQAERGSRTTPLADVRVTVPDVGDVAVLQAKAANVVQHFGGATSVARMLRVARSQPGRWVRGTEQPSARSTRHLVDLDYVVSRLAQLYEPATATTWIASPNAFLNGARPIDVLLTEGPAEVIAAIDASVAGSFA